ncbi:MAG TPA: zf-TFIIB domain-containing protein [Kribbellaceae bacterium]|nr:zf-TFIIB domain-containing protein [Kribbellaceae bacterium]
MDQLTCPKCHGSMRVYERSGVTVDQCSECRGIFLDRGELEKLLDAEAAFNAAQPVQSQPAPPQQYDDRRGYDDRRDDPRYDDRRGYDDPRGYDKYRGQPYRKKKKSFLEDLFD